MKPKWVYLFKTGLLTVLVGACMTMAPLSRLARIGLQPAAAAEKYGILGREAPQIMQDYRSGGNPLGHGCRSDRAGGLQWISYRG